MSIQYEVSAKVGDDKNGTPQYRKIGVVVKTQKGYMLKLETIPVIGWDGWAYLNQPKARDPAAPAAGQQRQQKSSQNFDDLDDDIPF